MQIQVRENKGKKMQVKKKMHLLFISSFLFSLTKMIFYMQQKERQLPLPIYTSKIKARSLFMSTAIYETLKSER